MTTHPATPRAIASWRRPLWLAALVASICLLISWRLDRRFAPQQARGEPTWIWVADPRFGEPAQAIALIRDFDLDGPTLGSPEARATLLVAADAEVVIYLNGVWVGGLDRQRAAATAKLSVSDLIHHPKVDSALFDISRALLPGRNRLYLEARTEILGGAVLVDLGLESAGALVQRVVSDGSWSIARRAVPGLRDGWLDLRSAREPAELEAPRVWGTVGFGRYVDPHRTATERPVLALQRSDSQWAASIAPTPQLSEPAAATFSEQLELRFATAAEGYLEVHLPPDSAPLWFDPAAGGLAAADPLRWRRVLLMPGQSTWLSATPLRSAQLRLRGQPPLAARLISSP